MSLKKAYLYLVSIIALIIMVTGGIILINMALKTWVFTKADKDYYSGPCISNKAVPPGEASTACTPEEEARNMKMQEENRSAQKQRDAAQAVAMLLVASPVWYFHWRMARKES
ncbi:MAG: hypothetical protein KW804_02000 [Candidatus Doudnabacteria bacterium]|nr:hypothetical protein [Candidatus Doudnabacteria bacterium]